MPKLSVFDFSGGRNVREDQKLIEDRSCASASINVWAPLGALEKAPGITEFASLTATANRVTDIFPGSIGNTNYVFGLVSTIASGSGSTNTFLWDLRATPTPLGYVTGTVSVSGASLVSATGSGTLWSDHVAVGDLLRINATANNWLTVTSIQDNTHLTLRTATPVAVATGSAYTILKQLGTDGVDRTIAKAPLNGSFWFSDGIRIPQRLDATGVTNISAFPSAFFCAVHQNYMFTARTTANESRLQWSAIKDPASWPANNFIDVEKDKGKITGLYSYGNELVVFKTYGVYKVVGEIFDPSNPTYSVYPLSVPFGFIFNSGSAVTVHNGVLVFFTFDGLYQYVLGTGTITKITDTFDLDLFKSSYLGDHTSIAAASSTYKLMSYKNYLFFVFITENLGGVGDNALGVLDRRGAWWAWKNATGTGEHLIYITVVPSPAGSGEMKILGTNTTDAKARIYELDFSFPEFEKNYLNFLTGAGIAIPAVWVSKEFSIGFGYFDTIVVYLEKQAAGNLTVDWSVDQAAVVSNSVDMSVGRGNLIRAVLPINQTGSTIQITLKNSTSSQTFKVYGFEINYTQDSEVRKR